MNFVFAMAIFISSQVIFSQDLEGQDYSTWSSNFEASQNAISKSNYLEQESKKILNKNNCENATEIGEELAKLTSEFADYKKSTERLMRKSCKKLWYYGNAALANHQVIRVIYKSDKIIDRNLCMQLWINYMEVWRSYKVNVENKSMSINELIEDGCN